VKPLRECIGRGPQMVLGQVWLAATLARLGQLQAARTVAAKSCIGCTQTPAPPSS